MRYENTAACKIALREGRESMLNRIGRWMIWNAALLRQPAPVSSSCHRHLFVAEDASVGGDSGDVANTTLCSFAVDFILLQTASALKTYPATAALGVYIEQKEVHIGAAISSCALVYNVEDLIAERNKRKSRRVNLTALFYIQLLC